MGQIAPSSLRLLLLLTSAGMVAGCGTHPDAQANDTFVPVNDLPSSSVSKPSRPPTFSIQPSVLDANTQVAGNFATISPLLNPNQCLDNPGGNAEVGTPMWIWSCNNYGPAQQWSYSGGYISVQHGTLCLDLLSDNISATVQVVINTCDPTGGHPQQLWTYDANHLQITGTSQCLSLPDTTASPGSKLSVSACSDTDPRQQWGIDNNNASLIRGAPIESASDSNKCLDLADGNTANGAAVDLSTCTFLPRQQWVLEGQYVRAGGRCLAVSAANTLVELNDCTGGANQQWVYSNGALQLAGQGTLCLTLTGGDTSDGVRPQVSPCAGLTEQQWLVGG